MGKASVLKPSRLFPALPAHLRAVSPLRSAIALHIILLPLQFLQAAGDFFGVGAAVEGADAEIAFTLGAETAAGGDDYVGVAENFIEGLPTADAFGSAHPDVGSVH